MIHIDLHFKLIISMILSISFSSQKTEINDFIYFNNETPKNFNENNKEKFIDSAFPLSIAIGNDKFLNPEIINSDIELRRPEEIFGENYRLFNKQIEVNDNFQGGIGNCYLISTLAALAKYPPVIFNIFHKINRIKGYYEIKIKSNDKWYLVIIDDLLPVNKKTGSFVFSDTNTNEIWTLLIEKAWAKFLGSYSKIESGSPFIVFSSFTDFKTNIHLRSETNMQSILTSQFKNGSIIVLQSPSDKCQNDEIAANHAYTLMNIKNEEIVVRNPWGRTNSGQTITNGETNIPFNQIVNNFEYIFVAEVDEKYKKLNKYEYKFASMNKKNIIKGKMYSSLKIYPQFAIFFEEMLNDPSFKSDECSVLKFDVFLYQDNTVQYIGFVKLKNKMKYQNGIGVQVYNPTEYVYGIFEYGNLVNGFIYNTKTKSKTKIK